MFSIRRARRACFGREDDVKPAAFSYHRPASVDEALALLAQHQHEAKLLAGGQSLVPMMNMRLAAPAHLIDLNDLSELAQVRLRADHVEVGALARHRALAESGVVQAHCPLLAQAARTIGHYAIRERGTLGGSLAHADPAAQHPLVAVTLGAHLTLVRQGSRRELAAGEFLQAAMTTALDPDEMVVSVRYPRLEAGEVSAFRMFNLRHGDFALIAVAATMTLAQGRVVAMRLGVGGATPVPLLLSGVTDRYLGEPPSLDWIGNVARAARDAVEPAEHPRVPADYRKELTETLVARALARCAGHDGADQ
jgi:carbon-monoxide dehydrogenase medium subunit